MTRAPSEDASALTTASWPTATMRFHLDAVVGVACGGVAFDPRVDLRASRAGALFTLEHQHPRALAKDEAVAPAIERPRCRSGTVVVARRHRAHPREAEDHPRQHTPIGPA
jgi:hypothetical protein